MMMPEPMLSNETPNPSPTRAENALAATGMLSTIQRSCVARNVSPDSPSAPNITKADVRACSPRESSMMSVSPAAIPSGNGRFSSSMKCLRNGTANNTPSTPAADSQTNV